MTYPIYYTLGHCFYMITGEKTYMRVTCYEGHNQYGITTEPVLKPDYIIKHGKETNQYEFHLAFTKARAQLDNAMIVVKPELFRTEIPY